MKNKTLSIILVLIILLSFSSCRDKNEQTDYNENIKTASDIPKAEKLFFDVFNFVYIISYDSSLLNYGLIIKDAATVRYFEEPERKYFISYGNYYKKCPDNLQRKGYYNVFLSDNFLTPNSTARVEFIDYYVEQYKHNGSINITNLGKNNSGGYSFEVKIDAGLISNKRDSLQTLYTHWNSTNSIYSYADDSTANLGIMGNTNGIASTGASFTTVVVDTLIRTNNCKWFKSGSQSLSTPSLDVKTGSIIYTDTCSRRVNFYFDGLRFYTDLRYK